MEYIKRHIRDVQDFPQKGVLFKDLTTAFKNPDWVASTEKTELTGPEGFAGRQARGSGWAWSTPRYIRLRLPP